MTTFDVDINDKDYRCKDPLDLIIKNKEFVDHLRENGMNGDEVRNILDDWQGLMQEIPIRATSQDKAKDRLIDYAIRHTKALVNNEAITEEERKSLFKIWDRLCEERTPPLEKDKSGRPVVRLMYHPEECNSGYAPAKTHKQMIGFQTVLLYELIERCNTKYLQKDIFNFISELFEVAGSGQKFSQNQIANFYKNNL